MLFFVIAMQIIAVLIVGLALLLTGVTDPLEPSFWIMLSAILAAVIGINWLVLTVSSEPLKQLTAALAQTRDEKSSLAPPNPNTTRYEKSGLKPLLQTIYEFGASASAVASATSEADEKRKKESPSESSDVGVALMKSKAGVAILDKNRHIIYSNSSAPVRTDPDGNRTLQLEFYTDQSLDDWIGECEDKAVHAEKTWARIASKPIGEEDRKVYDISASYEKGSEAPVVVVLLEKTAEYAPEDDDLNFIAFAAHELRGPITVIRGYLDTLNEELSSAISEEQQELFDRLIVSANRLSSYVNNILNSSRYDRRHLSVHLVETTVPDIYTSIADDMQLRASSQQRMLSVNLPATLPSVAADITSVGEVLGNLIDNAIKYSNEGGIVEIAAEQRGDFVEVSVRDHGIGMPPNVVSNLFHKFYRSHRSRETVAGTGIGLYISKAIVESHGGAMEVRSVEGTGSTFSFTLPIYATVADKLAQTGGTNSSLIAHKSGGGSWIKNHGTIRG